MKAKHAFWILVPLSFGLSAFALQHYGFGGLGRAKSAESSSICLPEPIELGERELGETVIPRFSISNKGGVDLIIDEIHSTCSCIGLDREEDGHLVHVESLRIQPGEKVELALRLSVKGKPGERMRHAVLFRTNDPSVPDGAIETIVSRIVGGIVTDPSAILFGSVRNATVAQRIVKVYDDGIIRRKIKLVESSRAMRSLTDRLAA